jgi:hypothetical protein
VNALFTPPPPFLAELDGLMMAPDKVAARRESIGASDLPVIMGGDEERLLELWRFKCGGESADLSDVLPVMLGCYTEPFNLALLHRRAGYALDPCEPVRNGFMTASPDAIADGDAVVDAKHCGPYKSEAEIGAYYAPQLFAQMHVTGKRRAVLSVIRGNSDFFWLEYDWAEDYGALVVDAAAQFWRHVQEQTPPVPLPAPPVPLPKGVRVVDMSSSNAWTFYAEEYLETMLPAGRHDAAKKALKELVEPDVTRAFGHGVELKRAKNGALRFGKEIS